MLYEDLINQFVEICVKIIDNELTGIYLHGSMVMGCFNPDKSDIDIIVIIENDITNEQKMELMKHIVVLNKSAPPKGLEISIVKRVYCNPFVYPTPFELHFSPTHLQWFEKDPEGYVKEMKGTDKDLAAHFTIINRYGITLYGEEKDIVIGKVSKIDYAESIWSDIKDAKEDIKEDPMYVILTLCRVLALLKDNLCLSKLQGGEWGLHNTSKRYHSLISQAICSYKTNQKMQTETELADEFANELLTLITIEMEKN